MNADEFCRWLQGFFELTDDDQTLSQRQINIVKDHLALVFEKKTPDRKLAVGLSRISRSDPNRRLC